MWCAKNERLIHKRVWLWNFVLIATRFRAIVTLCEHWKSTKRPNNYNKARRWQLPTRYSKYVFCTYIVILRSGKSFPYENYSLYEHETNIKIKEKKNVALLVSVRTLCGYRVTYPYVHALTLTRLLFYDIHVAHKVYYSL